MNDEIYHLMLELFDKDEIRPQEQLTAFIEQGICKIVTTKQKEVLESILIYFDLEDYVFIDYLGINPLFHGLGLGSKVMKQFLEKQTKLVLLEVEKVDNQIKQRRVNFYERLGLYLNDGEYSMDSYYDSSLQIPMKIMSYPNALTTTEFNDYVNKIKEDIYGKSVNRNTNND